MENTVELIGWYGGDEVNACSAWTSTSRELTDEKRARIPKLLKMLAENGHETPFEKSTVHFLVNTDIASHIHLLKHRISSLNAESARYKELKEDKYYIPEDWPLYWQQVLADYTIKGNDLYHECLTKLEEAGVDRKRAKESARFFKTYNSQIQSDVMFNWRSFVNFQRLRNSEHAQLEIRDVAAKMLDAVKNIEGNPFEHTIEAFSL
jgi:flavin-dependent thymidylate synthase